jgi:hypothetical protein
MDPYERHYTEIKRMFQKAHKRLIIARKEALIGSNHYGSDRKEVTISKEILVCLEQIEDFVGDTHNGGTERI